MDAGARRQFLFALCLALLSTGLLLWLAWNQPLDFGAWWHFPVFTAFTVFIICWGFPAPHIGQTSLERVAQVAPLLIFGVVEAALINAVASLIWPFLDRRIHGFIPALSRGLHNLGMFTLMILAGGGLYHFFGGPVPLRELSWQLVLLLIMLGVVMQAINEVLYNIRAWLQHKRFTVTFSLPLSLFEMGTVGLAVCTALFYNLLSAEIFILFALLLMGVVVVLKGFADARGELETRLEQMFAVNRIGRAIGASLILDDLVDMIYRECRELFQFSAFYLVLHDEQENALDFRLHYNDQGRQPRKRKPMGEGILGWIIDNNAPLLIESWATASDDIKRRVVIVGETPQSFIGVPVTYGERVLGAISIQSYTPGTFTVQDRDLMTTFAAQVAVAIINARLYTELEQYRHQLEFKVSERTRELNEQKEEQRRLSESLRATNLEKEKLLQKLERQTREDSLTELANRRYMDERLALELRRAERFGHIGTMAVADLDHFKQINDTLGHQVGDEVLCVIADILRHQCRAIDMISRYGGEEFVLYFPETKEASAMEVCEKIRLAVQEYNWNSVHDGLKVTISIGIAAADENYAPDILFAAADAKLYEAKRAGRNKVCG
ncbi:MAG TPA: diguanylate cyclase [Gammaproteobacteria bacterium]|nr:diguanylate cyclase [Gammaproteobacteria bacterium]